MFPVRESEFGLRNLTSSFFVVISPSFFLSSGTLISGSFIGLITEAEAVGTETAGEDIEAFGPGIPEMKLGVVEGLKGFEASVFFSPESENRGANLILLKTPDMFGVGIPGMENGAFGMIPIRDSPLMADVEVDVVLVANV